MKQINEIELRRMIRNKEDMSCINTSRIITMNWLFTSEKGFNQNISNWDVGNVNNMYQMFEDAENFNQDLSKWDIKNVDNMDRMFKGATAFLQGKYLDKTLISWAEQKDMPIKSLINIVT